MTSPIFSVITTAKYEKDKKLIEETFQNWEIAKQLFEEKTNKKIEFIIADGGSNVEFPKIKDSTLINQQIYEKYKEGLYRSGRIKYASWDSPSIGRNLGFEYAKGKIVVFQDIDSLFSTGTETDYKYVLKLDRYRNYFEVIHNAFRRKNIVAAAPSSRARDSKKLGRRFGTMGLNYVTWFTLKLPTINIKNTPITGPSVPGCSFALLRDVALELWSETGLYDPELGVGEDCKFSRRVGKYGRISYEKMAGSFIRTSRVSSGLDIFKSLGYAFKGSPYYFFLDLWKYKKHTLSI